MFYLSVFCFLFLSPSILVSATEEDMAEALQRPTSVLGVLDIASSYDVFLFDVHGVLVLKNWNPLGKSAERLQHLKSLGKKCYMVSNTHYSLEEAKEKLESKGFNTSVFDGGVTADDIMPLLAEETGLRGKKAFLVGNNPISNSFLKFFDMTDTMDDADFIFATADIIAQAHEVEEGLLEKVSKAQPFVEQLNQALKRGLSLFIPSPDKLRKKDDGRFIIHQGLFGDYYTRLGGKLIVGGKPSKIMFDFLVKQDPSLGLVDHKNILMVGDNLSTDIAFAHNIGVDSLLINHALHSACALKQNSSDQSFVIPTFQSSGL